MCLKQHLSKIAIEAIQTLYDYTIESVEIQHTRKEFEGEYTLVVFPLIGVLKRKPEEIGNQIGDYLKDKGEIADYNTVKGFLNLSLKKEDFEMNFIEYSSDKNFGFKSATDSSKLVMVEYASPNTNKPLHLGHVRNNLLGYSVAQILVAAGNKVIKCQIVNDRGIHICKSMLAWAKFGNGETPASTQLKGDHFVGKYYVIFDKEYKKGIKQLVDNGLEEEQAKKEAPIFKEAQEMLRKWEAADQETIILWKKMNAWVYEGFEETYKRLGVSFDQYLYESDTYLLGKDLVAEGLKKGVFYKKEDQSVWVDLTADGLDEKIVLRSDGTSVYMTQDLGTAVERFNINHLDEMVYVVGNEQDYHFKVLFLILEKLGYSWAKYLEHLSYGMVDLPEGKMKSREGTVVDADELMEEVYQTAKEISEELGKLEDYTEEEKNNLYEITSMGALKYHILKIDAKKRILFDPKESVDFNGNTGPFIQYAYARIQSLFRKESPKSFDWNHVLLNETEKEIIRHLNDYQDYIEKAAEELNPSLIANYAYDLVKIFNHFYQNHSIFNAENNDTKHFRLCLAQWVANTIASSLKLLGIQVPERM